jgi:hypothetical protein
MSHMAKDSIQGEKIRKNDSRAFCDMCKNQRHEDILYMIWKCLHAQEVWTRARETTVKAPILSQNFQFRFFWVPKLIMEARSFLRIFANLHGKCYVVNLKKQTQDGERAYCPRSVQNCNIHMGQNTAIYEN